MLRLRSVCLMLLALVALPGFAPRGFAQAPPRGHRPALHSLGQGDTAAIQKVLDMQVAGRNRGDLEGYMAGYWKSPDLTFYGGVTVTRGWDATLARYRKRYQSAGKASMGKLALTEMEIASLGPKSAMARGRWHLAMPDGKQLGGLTTLILRHLPEGWLIVHDHSCSD